MRWILPDFVEDVLPPEAERVERVRRALIDTSHGYGYALVQPPLLEYADSLSAGAGEDLAGHTFKVVDQLSGAMLGIRADMTPQVARIDAHAFSAGGVNRLCYTGSVLHTTPTALNPTREVLQAGAELYGVDATTADLEVLAVLLDTLKNAGVHDLHVDIGHVAIFQHLSTHLSPQQKASAREALAHKESTALDDSKLSHLLNAYGKPEVVLASLHSWGDPTVAAFASELSGMCRLLQRYQVSHSIDLADVPGYHYHSGLVFAVYSTTLSTVLARGGRYKVAIDGSRTATGFSLDMRLVANC
ncbi:MAG: hypothetical protein RLZZ502_992, partial [Pseudomonadota bacterium]